MNQSTPCPCTHTKPCSINCICYIGLSSSCCRRCCSSGRPELRRAKAEQLARIIDNFDELLAVCKTALEYLNMQEADNWPPALDRYFRIVIAKAEGTA